MNLGFEEFESSDSFSILALYPTEDETIATPSRLEVIFATYMSLGRDDVLSSSTSLLL